MTDDETGSGAASPLERLLFEFLERREVEGDGVLEELCAAHPELAESLREHVERVRETSLLEPPAEAGVPERLGDFQLLEKLGSGGMGIVYRARQESLDREVALKLVRPEQLYFGEARARFLREVMVVARLNHPGIVPVYSVGEENGLPYFAMERVRGATLGELLEALGERPPESLTGADLGAALERALGEAGSTAQTPLFGGTWEQTGLRILRDVAEALEHAHRLGVLHRDVKPSNVMLTPEGRVMLLDFGLSSEEGAERLTRTGSAVGSLPYMAPELFGGEGATRASDVYALGATLFELLTLGLPVAFSSVTELRANVTEGALRQPRTLNSSLSWEAETVCLKALEREPAHRYESAEAFARDLTNVLERRPVHARRASALRRSRRWIERHTGAAVAIALAVVLLVGGPIVYAAQARRAMLRVEAESELARANLRKAVDAIHSSLSELARAELRNVPQASGIRRAVASSAIRLFEDLAQANPDDLELERRMAQGWAALGLLQRDLGELEASEASFGRALEIQASLVSRHGERPELRVELARSWFERSALSQAEGDVDAATRSLEEALHVVLAGAPQGEPNLEMQRLLGVITLDLGRTASNQHELAEAEQYLRESVACGEDVLEMWPGDLATRLQLGRAHRMLADTLVRDGRTEEARASYAAAIDLLEAYVEDDPGRIFSDSHLATAYGNLGALVVRSGEFEQGRALLRRAAGIHERILAAHPDQFEVGIQLGSNLQVLGSSYVREERPGDALEHYEAALAVLEPLYEDHPGIPGVRHELAQTLQAFAVANAQYTTVTDLARELVERAIELESSALADQPGNAAYARALATQRELLVKLGG